MVLALLLGINWYKTAVWQPIKVPLEQFAVTGGTAEVSVSPSGVKAVSEQERLAEGNTTLRSAPLTLRRGSYRVEVEYVSSSDYNSITLTDDESVTGIRGASRPSLAVKHTHLEFSSTFTRGTAAAQVELVYAGGALEVTGVSIHRTLAMGNAQLLLLFFVFALLDGFCWLAGHKTKQQIGCYAMVTAIGLFASLPFFTNYYTAGIDLEFHLLRIEGIKDALLSGQFPVRMQPPWYGGAGYPVSVLYGDAFLYFPAVLRILGLDVGQALNVFRIALNLATAALAYLAFQKIFRHSKIALLGAGLYTLSLYRLTNLFNRGALGEAIAMAFFPLVLLGLYQIYFEACPQNKGWLWLSLGLGGLINSHLLSCVLAAGLMLLWALALLRRTLRWSTLRQFLKAAVATLGMNLWFLLPFLDYSRLPLLVFTNQANTLNATGLFLLQLFMLFPNVTGVELGAKQGYVNEMGYSLGLAFLIGIFCLLYAFYTCWRQKNDEREKKILTLGVVALAVGGAILAASLSVFPWDLLQRLSPLLARLVSMVQFLSRLLSPAAAVLALGSCCGLWLLCKKRAPYRQALAFGLCLCSAVSAMYFFDEGMARTWETRRTYDVHGLDTYINHANEYLYDGVHDVLFPQAVTTADNPRMVVESSEQKGITLVVRGKNTGTADSFVTTPLLYYPYYHAENIETGEELPIGSGANHMLQVQVPAGFEGSFRVYYREPWHWRLAELVSLLSLLGVGGWQTLQKRRGPGGLPPFQKNRSNP